LSQINLAFWETMCCQMVKWAKVQSFCCSGLLCAGEN